MITYIWSPTWKYYANIHLRSMQKKNLIQTIKTWFK